MTPFRAQSVGDADRDIRQYLIRAAATIGDALPDGLFALYVHGSLAAGTFRRERSGIDLLAVVSRRLVPSERAQLARNLVLLSDARPVAADIDVAVVREGDVRSYVHPMPIEVRYRADLHELIRRGRIDYERNSHDVTLAGDILSTRERGVVLVGPPAERVFGPVPWHAYIAGLHEEFLSTGRELTQRPLTAILAACRVLYGTSEREMHRLPKDQAAAWALERIPDEFRSVVNDALQLYRGTKTAEDVVLHEHAIRAFRSYVAERAQPAFERAADSGE